MKEFIKIKSLPGFMGALIYFSIAVSLVILAGCTRPQVVDITTEAETLRNLQNQMISAYQKSDVEKVISNYAPDAVVMSPGSPVETGVAEIRKSLESIFADTTLVWEKFSWTNDMIDVSAGGDLAFIRITSLTGVKTQEGVVMEPGKGVDIWKKINGEWKLILDTWNFDK